eukprot:TRINITY_DN1667_c0_g1_i2.p1 TRINITY_DN1667_c0_g1~~TRINITY_DN1667_c0_g1_i2.p1  ORF type:complete len:497 (-),score=84.89 TRINITY_DN1667_c0_g1_i2:58-1548(-)
MASIRFGIFLILISFASATLSPSTASSIPPTLPQYDESKFSYLTILYNDEMAPAVHVLQSSLQSVKSAHKLHALVTSSVSSQVQERLELHGIALIQVPEVTIGGDHAHRGGKTVQQRWRKNLTKLWLWKMTQFEKVVYLDADTLVVQNIDHLFACKGPICAGINTPIPDKFNTGLMVFKPDDDVFEGMVAEWKHIGFFEDVEQGLLNHYYPLSNFDRDQILPFKYNAFAYCEDKNVLETIDDVYVIHFVRFKPWQWASYPAGDLGFVWRQYYEALSPDFKENIEWKVYGLAFFPLALVLIFYLGIDHKSVGNRILKRVRIHWMSNLGYLLFAFGFEATGHFISYQMIPYITDPLLAWIIVYEWSLFFFLIPVILWTSAHYAEEIKISAAIAASSPPLLKEEKNESTQQRSSILFVIRYWRFFILLLVIQPFLTIFMDFYYHTENPETPITLRCVIMFLTVALPLHLLGIIFACLVPRISRKIVSESRVSPREISKL